VPQQGRDIVVGTGAWLGSNVTVLGPCSIGAHAVIAAGAVVTGVVEAGWIYGGVPARPIKRIEFAQASSGAGVAA
jgi:acetyltransferase-like isoleucine patch superfamily enzyme